ncbi:hypothetical protein AXF42_Ash018219 [Apostasia shenzhenica]|uniref:Uncharacterized protein n=1 Tax=Apostasia shenzhenica TaxID=1088818 RepID=A0A2I0B1D4_9ASPA|nr:hypothetical protein AXF42_Ash018219 [Apostasia shenzhenica]
MTGSPLYHIFLTTGYMFSGLLSCLVRAPAILCGRFRLHDGVDLQEQAQQPSMPINVKASLLIASSSSPFPIPPMGAFNYQVVCPHQLLSSSLPSSPLVGVAPTRSNATDDLSVTQSNLLSRGLGSLSTVNDHPDVIIDADGNLIINVAMPITSSTTADSMNHIPIAATEASMLDVAAAKLTSITFQSLLPIRLPLIMPKHLGRWRVVVLRHPLLPSFHQ